MISFMNDYSEGAHPKVLELMVKANMEQNTGYGEDAHSDRAKEYIKKQLNREDVDIHFIPGGTQTNLLVISSFLRPHQCVIAVDTGHINVHETGAIEAAGHKVIAMPGVEGKLTTLAIEEAMEMHVGEHMVQPKMVYLSDTTELGTIYTKGELTALHDYCEKKGLILFLDGARLGSALTSKGNDLTLEDIARLTDVFYIGGTKNGALLGEALVIVREDLKADFRYLIKQRGAMMAKGFVIGMQFEALFMEKEKDMEKTGESEKVEDRVKAEERTVLYYELGHHANRMAEQLAESFLKYGYSFYAPVCSNQLFPILPKEVIDVLSSEFKFQEQAKLDEEHIAVRFVTSWATSQDNIDEFVKALENFHR